MVLDGFWLASLFSVTVGLGLGVAMPRIAIRLAENQAGRTGAAVFMVIGTLMMSLSTLIDMSPFKALGLVGAVLSGLGAAVLYFAWGRAYALAGGEATEWAIPFSLCLAMVIALAASGMNAWVSSAVVALLPAISAGLLAFSFRRALKAPQVSQKTRSAEAGGGSSVVPMLRSLPCAHCRMVCLHAVPWDGGGVGLFGNGALPDGSSLRHSRRSRYFAIVY